MDPVKYLCIDTNNFVQCCIAQLDNEDTIAALDKLLEQMDAGRLVLLLPEVVKIEFPKVLRREMPATEDKIKRLKDTIKDSGAPETVVVSISALIDKSLETRNEIYQKAEAKVNAIFGHKNTKLLPITGDALVESYKIYLSGERPVFKKSIPSETSGGERKKKEEEDRERARGGIQADAVIVASLKTFLESLKDSEYDFYLCSNDSKAFADGSENEPPTLHTEIQKHFKKIKFFSNLGRLLNEEFASAIDDKVVQTLESPTVKSSVLSGDAQDERSADSAEKDI